MLLDRLGEGERDGGHRLNRLPRWRHDEAVSRSHRFSVLVIADAPRRDAQGRFAGRRRGCASPSWRFWMNLATPPCQHRWRSFIYSRMGMARAQRGIFQGRAAADQTPSALPTVTVSQRSKRPERSGGSAGPVTSAFLMPFSIPLHRPAGTGALAEVQPGFSGKTVGTPIASTSGAACGTAGTSRVVWPGESTIPRYCVIA